MPKTLKSAPLWSGILAIIYLVLKNWIGFEIPAWNDISEHIITILTIIWV